MLLDALVSAISLLGVLPVCLLWSLRWRNLVFCSCLVHIYICRYPLFWINTSTDQAEQAEASRKSIMSRCGIQTQYNVIQCHMKH